MNIPSRLIIVLSSLTSFVLLGVAGAAADHSKPHAAKGHLTYAKVEPLIKTKCEPCHNAKAHPEAINLSSFEALMKSGEHGPIVIAGHPEKSKLIQYVDGEKKPRMPYRKPPLSGSEIGLLKQWIVDGAKK